MLYKTLGTRIRDERLKLNLTQEELAEKANISPSYMGRIERGERNPTLENLVLCQYLGHKKSNFFMLYF